jgi:hypothetical protein
MDVKRSIDQRRAEVSRSNSLEDPWVDGHTMLTEPTDNKPVLNEQSFQRMISVERKRTERSRKPFLLMLVDTGNDPSGEPNKVPHNIVPVLSSVTRDTDVMGWYRDEHVFGVMFTEIAPSNKESILKVMLARIGDALRRSLLPEEFSCVNLSFQLFPEDWEFDKLEGPTNPAFYPDLVKRQTSWLVPWRCWSAAPYSCSLRLPSN